jgi:hypothetical protein
MTQILLTHPITCSSSEELKHVSVFEFLSYTVQGMYKKTVFMELNNEILKDLHIL